MKTKIKTLALTPIAFAIFYQEERERRKAARIRQYEGEAYAAMIAESQAKIGPYKPQTCPTQIWA
jgi:hypothetical protein